MGQIPWVLRCGIVLLLPLGGPSAVRAQADDTKAIDVLIQESLKAWGVPGAAVVIVQNDRITYLKGGGVRRWGSKEPVTEDTLFPLSSCTKAFTALLLAQLMDEGKLSWDDPVRKHLPTFRLADPLADAQVTLRDLLCHRTGVAGHDLLSYRAPWNVAEQIRRTGLLQPNRPFRSSFQYQNVMVMAAGQAAGSAAQKPWADLIRERLFLPLEMKNSYCTTAPVLKSADHAEPHRRGKDGKLEVIPWYVFDEPNPAVSICTSARDLGKWLRFQLGDGTWKGKRLVTQENLSEPHTPQNIIRLEGSTRATHPFTVQMSYGFGWVIQEYRGQKLISHAGLIDGMRTHITLVPNSQLGVGILSNMHQTRMNLALSNLIVDRLLGLPYFDWNRYYQEVVKAEEAADEAQRADLMARRKPDTKASHPLPAYAGTYEEPAYGTARIVVENGQLTWQWNSFKCPLEHYHFDTFILRNELLKDPLLVFQLSADGVLKGFRLLDVDFKRVGDDGPKR